MSRSMHAKDMEKNTRYFHNLASLRRRNNRIDSLVINGRLIRNQAQIKIAIREFFKDLYHQERSPIVEFRDRLLNIIDEDSIALERIPTTEEVREADWDCESSKALGIDWYNMNFIKKFWDEIGTEFTTAVLEFFRSSRLPSDSNITWVDLAPKFIRAKEIKDLKPISMVGCISKVISKMMVRRLRSVMPGANPKLVRTWKPIIDKVEEKLISWMAKVLNNAAQTLPSRGGPWKDIYQLQLKDSSNVRDKMITGLSMEKEVTKLLEARIIYPISDNPWVSPVQVVPKKGGMTVVHNEKNELVPTRTVTGWRMCIDYRRLNTATRKDHFPLPFMDQMLERLAGHDYYYFLDGYSGYNQIAVDPQDQEKTSFTYPSEVFAYRRMPFGLCNAPATFQRCMLSIFSYMVEKFLEVFMDDFSVYGDSFSSCLDHLTLVLKRCQETNLVLNWEKCHFMVTEGIVLGHKISNKGIEVDQAKVEVIEKLPPPVNVKAIRSFLGHAGFYRRFIKDFS
ncbi:uncharacterized protein LOC110272052, partial [Arachis ipaensis]|uniref:uncharacterized protein LOC110272052 n=1 Tax=Arachis ipaensis TaxID=130454 RepID=UPI000A2B649E